MAPSSDVSIPPPVGSRWPTRDSFITAAKLYAANAPEPFSVRLDRVKAPGASSPNSRAGLSIVCRTGTCGASFRVLQEGFNSGDWIVTQQNLNHQHDGDVRPVKRTRASQLVAEAASAPSPPRQSTSRAETVAREARERSVRASSEASSSSPASRDPFRVGTHWTSPSAIERAMRTAGEAASPAWDVKGVGYVVAGHWTPSSHASIRFRCVGCVGADDQGEGSCHFSIHLQQDLLGAGAWTVTRAILGHSHSTRLVPVIERTPSPIGRRTVIAHDSSPFLPSLSPAPPFRRGSADTAMTQDEDAETEHEQRTPPPPERPDPFVFDVFDPFATTIIAAGTPKSGPNTPMPRPVLSPRASFGFR